MEEVDLLQFAMCDIIFYPQDIERCDGFAIFLHPPTHTHESMLTRIQVECHELVVMPVN